VESSIERKGTNETRLTLAVNRFAVKLQDGLTPEQEAWLLTFANHVDAKMRPELTQTLRGHIGISLDKNGSVSLRKNNRERLSVINSAEFNMPPYPEDA
jgi:hypothetical protein